MGYSSDTFVVPEYIDLIGGSFERGARGPDVWDCYGLVREMNARAGIEIPDFLDPGSLEKIEHLIERNSKSWTKVPFGTVGSTVTMRLHGIGSHVVYMIKPDKFIHAIEGSGVVVERISLPPYKDSKMGAYVYA